MSNKKSLPCVDLTKTAFSLRFQQLQEALNDSLRQSRPPLDAVLEAQDRMILRLEGWIDSLADLHMWPKSDIDLFRHTLDINRKVYRLKTLELHNVAVSDVEKNDLERALHLTMRKIPTKRTGLAYSLPSSGPH